MIDEVGDPEANIQTDSEGAAVDLARAAAALRPDGGHEVKVTPRGSSQSNGVVERMNQTVAAMCRTFKVLVEDEYNIKLGWSVTVLGSTARDARADRLHSKS